jgi:elongation factor Ts
MDNNLLKELRDQTGAGMLDVKAALDEAAGDKDKAIEILRKKGQAKLSKKADRAANEGLIESYIHAGGKVGVLVELNSETDFVSRTEDFQKLAKELAMHIAAANPLYVSIADVPTEVIEKEKEINKEQMAEQLVGKPADMVEKITAGKLNKFYEEVCLMEQPFFREPEKKVREVMANQIAKMGENVVVKRFSRFVVGN